MLIVARRLDGRPSAVEVAERLADQGIGVTVVDPRWVKPVDPALVDLARDHRLVVSVEDNGRVGGCGATLLQLLNDARVDTPFRLHGIPQEFLDHAKRDAILERIGLDAQALARGIVEDVTALDAGGRPVDADHTVLASRAATVRRRAPPARCPSLLPAPRELRPSGDSEPTGPAVHAPDVVRGLTGLLDRRADAATRRRRGQPSSPASTRPTPIPSRPAELLRQPRAAAAGRVRLADRPGEPHPTGRSATGAVVDVHAQLDGYDEVPVVTRDRYQFTRGTARYRLRIGQRPRPGEDDARRRASPGTTDRSVVRSAAACSGIFDPGSEVHAGGRHRRRRERHRAESRPACPLTGSARRASTRSPTRRSSPGSTACPATTRPALDAVAFPVPALDAEDGERRQHPVPAATRTMLDATSETRARLIRHELTHVALGLRADDVPTWLSEGIAEYVSVQPMAPEDQTLSREALRRRRGRPGHRACRPTTPSTGRTPRPAYASRGGRASTSPRRTATTMLWFLLELRMGSDDPDEVLELVVGVDADDARAAWRRS